MLKKTLRSDTKGTRKEPKNAKVPGRTKIVASAEKRRPGSRAKAQPIALSSKERPLEKGPQLLGARIFVTNIDKPESHLTPLEKMHITRLGVSKKNLVSLKDKTQLDYDELAQALSVTRATLINKKDEEKFNSALSERIVGLADIYSYGYEVFDDQDRFNQWMFQPNKALGGQIPYELVDNQFGRQEVRNIIGRIEYGVFS